MGDGCHTPTLMSRTGASELTGREKILMTTPKHMVNEMNGYMDDLTLYNGMMVTSFVCYIKTKLT